MTSGSRRLKVPISKSDTPRHTPASPVSSGESAAARADNEEVARLAYCYWLERGCPEGSPEVDWYRAESTIKNSQ